VIRVRHEPLPSGLSAVVRRRPGGDTDIVVSTLLTPARQRAAVRVGLRAARPADQRSVLPVPLVGLLALAWASTRAIARGLRMHPVALVTAAGAVTAVTAAAVVIAVVPQQHGPAGGGHPAAGVLSPAAPASAASQSAGRRSRGTQPAARPRSSGRPAPTVAPVADHSGTASSRPTPAPGASQPSSGSAQPSPTTPPAQPSPSPSTGSGGGVCVDLLGLRVCL
jgi:hypothetical protein